jgi:hypothetical protein
MPEPEKDVEVPEGISMNMTARDLRPYMGEDAKKMVQEELIGPQQYEMGVVPKHLTRAGAQAATSGTASALMGAGSAASAAYETGVDVLTAPARPDKLVNKADRISDLLDTAGDSRLPRKVTENALMNAGKNFGGVLHMTSNAVAPLADTYRAYKYPSSQAAETAAKRIAKAKRKKQRRQKEMPSSMSEGLSSLHDRFVRPFKEDAQISREIRKQMDKGGPIQMNAPSPEEAN